MQGNMETCMLGAESSASNPMNPESPKPGCHKLSCPSPKARKVKCMNQSAEGDS